MSYSTFDEYIQYFRRQNFDQDERTRLAKVLDQLQRKDNSMDFQKSEMIAAGTASRNA